MGQQITILVADSQPLFMGALTVALTKNEDLFVVNERPTSWSQVLSAVSLRKPDVALLDYWLPQAPPGQGTTGMDRTTALKEVREASPHTKVLLLSWSHGADDIRESLEAGAVGYLPKSLALIDLIDGIRRAHGGEPLVFAEQLHTMYEKIQQRAKVSAEIDERFRTLTPHELEVLFLLAKGKSSAEIADILFVSRATVNARIHKILSKTETKSQTEAVAMARRAGLLQS